MGTFESVMIPNGNKNGVNSENEFLQYINKLNYLENMICVGEAKASSIPRLRSGWKKFWNLIFLLIMSGLFLHTKVRLYMSYMRNAKLYDVKLKMMM